MNCKGFLRFLSTYFALDFTAQQAGGVTIRVPNANKTARWSFPEPPYAKDGVLLKI